MKVLMAKGIEFDDESISRARSSCARLPSISSEEAILRMRRGGGSRRPYFGGGYSGDALPEDISGADAEKQGLNLSGMLFHILTLDWLSRDFHARDSDPGISTPPKPKKRGGNRYRTRDLADPRNLD